MAAKLVYYNSLIALPVLYLLFFVSAALTQREVVCNAFSTLIAGLCATAIAQPSKVDFTILPQTTPTTELRGGENKPRTSVFTLHCTSSISVVMGISNRANP